MSAERALIPDGGTIALVGPSHAWNPERYAAGRDWLEARGYTLIEVGLGEPHRYYAADDPTRRRGLIDALTHPDVHAVWAIRGGSGVTRILAGLPLQDLPPKPILGFSDLTPLLHAWARRGGVAVHAPVVHSLGRTDAPSLDHLANLLAGEPTYPLTGQVLVQGSATGPLVGGNLALVAAACGTPYALDTQGAILVLEDVGEHPYRIERMLAQLRDAGVLAGVSGVALGGFTGCVPPDSATWTLRDIWQEWLGELGVPVVLDLPIGHGPANRAFVVGAPARLHQGVLELQPSAST